MPWVLVESTAKEVNTERVKVRVEEKASGPPGVRGPGARVRGISEKATRASVVEKERAKEREAVPDMDMACGRRGGVLSLRRVTVVAGTSIKKRP